VATSATLTARYVQGRMHEQTGPGWGPGSAKQCSTKQCTRVSNQHTNGQCEKGRAPQQPAVPWCDAWAAPCWRTEKGHGSITPACRLLPAETLRAGAAAAWWLRGQQAQRLSQQQRQASEADTHSPLCGSQRHRTECSPTSLHDGSLRVRARSGAGIRVREWVAGFWQGSAANALTALCPFWGHARPGHKPP
jgi:hypothetical protein